MIDEQIKIKLNQFILDYEKQCSIHEFEKQNIKQNVMLSILQTRNSKKNHMQPIISQLRKSNLKQKTERNLASSKETKPTEDQEINMKNIHLEQRSFYQMDNSQQSKFAPLKGTERLSTVINNNRVNPSKKLSNGPLEQQKQVFTDLAQKSRVNNIYSNSSSINSKICSFADNLNKQTPAPQKNQNNEINSILLKNNDQNHKQEQNNLLVGPSRGMFFKKNGSNQPQTQKKGSENYSQISQISQSNSSQKNIRIYTNSEKVIKPEPPIVNKLDQKLQQYPTFKRPSFQFIANIDDVRQCNPHHNESQEEQQNEEQLNSKNEVFGKWKTPKNDNPSHDQQFEEKDFDKRFESEQPQHIANIHEDESMMVTSKFNQTVNQVPFQKQSYMAFEINMDKSNLPSNESVEGLKKKKIQELERKRQERIENNSKRKQNLSEVQNSSKPIKESSSAFIPNKNQSKRQHDNRDSLNKSFNQKKNDRIKNQKSNPFKQEDLSKESVHQLKRNAVKYGEQSQEINRSVSPMNTVKTVFTDKRPPSSKNRKDDNIFAGDPSYQRQKSNQKLLADPKIIPIDRKNSFQKKSNIKIMVNAITYTCLPGQLNRRERQKLIDILSDYQSEYLIFLFKEYSRKVIKGIYILELSQQNITKIYGDRAPMQIYPEQVQEFYRFDSGSRQFKKIDGCKSFSFSVHAVDLK